MPKIKLLNGNIVIIGFDISYRVVMDFLNAYTRLAKFDTFLICFQNEIIKFFLKYTGSQIQAQHTISYNKPCMSSLHGANQRNSSNYYTH